jgi:hypothetical protein
VDFDLLRVSREPLEAQSLTGLDEIVARAWERATYLVPTLAATSESDETAALDQLCTWSALAHALADPELAAMQRQEALELLARQSPANPTIVGAACGLLYDDGAVCGTALGQRLAGHLGASTGDATQGARFLRGVLRAARSACWQEPSVVDAVHATLRDLPEDVFLAALPHLRLAYSDLTPRECDLVARAAAARCGAELRLPLRVEKASEADVLRAARADRAVAEILARDGWEPGGD